MQDVVADISEATEKIYHHIAIYFQMQLGPGI